MNGNQLASIVAIVAALILAFRGLRARPAAPGKRLIMAVTWLVIIVGLVFVLHMLGFAA